MNVTPTAVGLGFPKSDKSLCRILVEAFRRKKKNPLAKETDQINKIRAFGTEDKLLQPCVHGGLACTENNHSAGIMNFSQGTL